MLYKLCFINPYKVHTGLYTCEFVVSGQRMAWAVCIIFLALDSAALWFGGEVDSPPISPAASSTVGICPLANFLFY